MSKLSRYANAPIFPWNDPTLWGQPEYYSTLMMADINGDGKAELLIRAPNGVLAYSFDDAGGRWRQMAAVLSSGGIGTQAMAPEYYSTIRTGDVNSDGKAELMIRLSGPGGMVAYGFDEDSGSWRTIGNLPGLRDGIPTSLVKVFSTITLADVNGDGRAEVLARGYYGVDVYFFDDASGEFQVLETDPIPMSDANGWDTPQRYLTILAADINGDGRAEVLGRGPDGVVAYSLDGGQWRLLPGSPIPWGDSPWNQPQYYSTIIAADVNGDGRAEVLGRSPEGIEAYNYDVANGEWRKIGVITEWGDNAFGPNFTWTDDTIVDRARYYSTIRAADVNGDGKAEVLVRGVGGLFTYFYSDLGGGSFQRPLPSFGDMYDDVYGNPAVNDPTVTALVKYVCDTPALAPGIGWAARAHVLQQYYSTIRYADINGDGKAEMIAVSPSGLATYDFGADWARINAEEPVPPADNYALNLSGDNQYVTFNGYNFGQGDFTIELWFSTAEGGPLFSSSSGEQSPEGILLDQMSCEVLSDGSLRFILSDSGGSLTLLTGTTSVLDGDWHHVATVREGNNGTIYIDGEPAQLHQGGPRLTGIIDIFNQRTFYLGSASQRASFKGQIDEARVWSRALQHDEITEGMHHQLTGGAPDLVGHWTFDNHDASDTSGTSNDGGLQGQPSFVPSELDFAPPGESYLITQAKLMQDYRLDPESGRLTEINGYRVVISARTSDGYALPAEITIYSTTPTILYFADGTRVPVNQESPCDISTNVSGEVSFVIEAEEESLYAPVLKVRADFMASEERLVVSPDRHAHDTLASVTGQRLLGKDEDGNTLREVAKGRRQVPLPEGTTLAQSKALAQTIQYVMSMAVGHDIQPARSQVQSRALPEDVPAPRPYVPRYQNVRQLTRAYDAQTDAIATHFLPSDQLIERILVVENMPQAHWVWEHGTGTFTHLADDEVDQVLEGLSVQPLDDLAAKFQGKRKLSLTSDQLLEAATGEVAKRGLKSIFKKVKHATKVVVKTVEVEVEDAAEEAEKFVKTVVVTIVTEAEGAFDAALQTVEDAAEFVGAAIEKVGAAIKDFINYLKALFEWDDILKTQKVLAEYLEQLPDWTKDVITKIKDLVDTTLDGWQATMDREFDEFIERFGGQLNATSQKALPVNAPLPDVQNNYVLTLFAHNFTRISDPASFSLSDGALAQDLNDALTAGLQLGNPANLLAQAQAQVLGTNLLKLLSDPSKLLQTGMVEMLNILKGLMDIAWQVGRAVINAILNFIERVLDELYKLCTANIDIPLLTPFFELIAGGRPLTFFNFFALAAAIPLTVTYKAATGTDDPVFSDADYDFIHKTSWRDYDWLNTFVDAAVGGGTQPSALATRKSKPDLRTGMLWAGAYASAVATSAWGVVAMINDTPAGGASKASIWKASLDKERLTFFARVQVALEGGCWILAAPSVLAIQAWKASPTLQLGIWISQVIPLAVDFATLFKRNGTLVISTLTNAAIIGAYGEVLTVAYCVLAISQASSGASADQVLLPALLVNYPSSVGMAGQWLKLDPETEEFVPLVDMLSYGFVAADTIALTTADIDSKV